jgi:anti-sigma factor RsiW
MEPPDDVLRARIALLALGELSAGEAAAVALHVARCSACRSELEALRRTLHGPPGATAEVEPPAALKKRLLRSVRRGRRPT